MPPPPPPRPWGAPKRPGLNRVKGRNVLRKKFLRKKFFAEFIFDPYSQKFIPQKIFKIDQSQKFLCKYFSKFINRKNFFCKNCMAYRYFLLKNKTHFALFQVNFLSL